MPHPDPHIVFATHPVHGIQATSGHEQVESRALLTHLGWHPDQHAAVLLPPTDADPQDAAVHATVLLKEAGNGVSVLRQDATTPEPLHLDTAEDALAQLLPARQCLPALEITVEERTAAPAFPSWPRFDVVEALAEKLSTDSTRFQPLHHHRSADDLTEYRIVVDTETGRG